MHMHTKLHLCSHTTNTHKKTLTNMVHLSWIAGNRTWFSWTLFEGSFPKLNYVHFYDFASLIVLRDLYLLQVNKAGIIVCFSVFQIQGIIIDNGAPKVNRSLSCLNSYHWPWSGNLLILQNNLTLVFWIVSVDSGRSLTGYSNTFVWFLCNWVCAKINYYFIA